MKPSPTGGPEADSGSGDAVAAATASSRDDAVAVARTVAAGRFSAEMMYSAASLYYDQDATQAQIATRLGTSRATVSRLLAEARRQGIVRIEVVPPAPAVGDDGLAARAASALGLDAVWVAPPSNTRVTGSALAPALSQALTAVGLRPGDVVLISSGRTVYEAAQAELPHLPGVVLAPTIGGQDEPEPWYQTNEITREIALKVGGRPTFLYAPALPGAQLAATLRTDPGIQKVVALWESATCSVLGVGAPPLSRESLPGFVPTDAPSLTDAAGDVCSRFYDADGVPVEFPGSDRMMSTGLELLRRVPTGIAVAVGRVKLAGIIGGARGGYFSQLVTDHATAGALVAAAAGRSA